jgi:hypothetical protein
MFTPRDGFNASQSTRLDATAEDDIGEAPRPAAPRTAPPRLVINRERLLVLMALAGFWAWMINIAAHLLR